MNKKPPSVYSNPRSLYFPQFSDSLFIKSPPPPPPPIYLGPKSINNKRRIRMINLGNFFSFFLLVVV